MSSNAVKKSGQDTSCAEEEQATGREFEIYSKRFSGAEEAARTVTWEVLCREFFQQFVSSRDFVIDIGAGDGHFIRNIKARRRLAVDLSPHVLELKKYGIEVMNIPAGEVAENLDEPADAVFMSNFLEHMPTKRIMLDVLQAAWGTLRPGGKLMILQPNIRYAGASYWDYIDHHIALTEHSLCEALEISGFSVEKCIPRFLPYTVKSGVGAVAASSHTAAMVSWYLKLPILWRIFGAQTFVIARRLP